MTQVAFKLSTLPADTVSGPFMLSESITEGVLDPGVLKAVFLAGAGSSGKSTVSAEMFAGSGLKVIDQDKHLTKFLANASIPLSQVGQHYGLLKKAQGLKNAEVRQYGLRRLGMIIDSTGWDAPRILDPAKKLRSLGYDVYMVFVSTTLETALARNAARGAAGGRDVPDSFIQTAHEGAHKNLAKYKEAFGERNVFVIDNDKEYSDTAWSTLVASALRKVGRKILTAPLRNPVGKEWLEQNMGRDDEKKDIFKERKKWPREKPSILGSTSAAKPAQMPAEAPKLAKPLNVATPAKDGSYTVQIDGRTVKVNPWKKPAWMEKKVKEAEEEPQGDQIGKVFLADYDGLKWYIVDGHAVREWLTDFAGGGNPMAYPGLVPDDEGWIEDMKRWEDTVAFGTHEMIEYTRMKYAKEKYDPAHAASNDAEAVTRLLIKKAKP